MSWIVTPALGILLLMSAPHVPRLQRESGDREEVLKALMPVMLDELRSGALRRMVDYRQGAPWRIRTTRLDSTASRALRTAVLAAVGGRRPAAGDSALELLDVAAINIVRDSARVSVDRGRRWCAAGTLMSVGSVHSYVLARVTGAWQVIGRGVEIAYDAPPPRLPPRSNEACIRELAR